jgi:ATP-binding cassette subfamily C protein LapB
MHELSETTYRATALRNATLIESLVGLETLKALSAEGWMQKKWESSARFLSHVGSQLRLLSSSLMSSTAWSQQMVSLFIVIVGVYLIGAGQLSLGGLIASSMLAGRALAPLGQIAGLMTQYHNAMTALTSLDRVMEQPVERPGDRYFVTRERFEGRIELRDVDFTYPGQEQKVLRGISLNITAGEHVAILGRVGSGKSTLQRLMVGLYQSTAGAVLVDGIDVRQLDPAELRRHIGWVNQDATLFYGSLRENLSLGHAQLQDADLVQATTIAGLSEFINRHPKGFDLMVGERGETLSGGQRQAVAIARAVIHSPPILLLDEPTDSMDHSTEAEVKKQLQAFGAGKTLLIITHRTSLLELVDRIIVLDQGRIVADGPKALVVEALREGKIGKAP